MLPSTEELNRVDEATFTAALEPLFERAPSFLRRLAAERPFASHDELLERAEALAQRLPEDEQIELINSHPRIGAAPRSVSALSFREQGYDRDPGTAELQERLDRLNAAYEARLGFRFVIFVAGRSRAEVAGIIEQSVERERDEEKRRALRDVVAIARDRAARLRGEQEDR